MLVEKAFFFTYQLKFYPFLNCATIQSVICFRIKGLPFKTPTSFCVGVDIRTGKWKRDRCLRE